MRNIQESAPRRKSRLGEILYTAVLGLAGTIAAGDLLVSQTLQRPTNPTVQQQQDIHQRQERDMAALEGLAIAGIAGVIVHTGVAIASRRSSS